MRITIVQGPFLPVPPLKGGAVEKVWFSLGRQFARGGHTVVHISRKYPGLPDHEEVDGVLHLRIQGFDRPKSRLLSNAMDLIYSLRALGSLPKADILITNTFWLPILVRTNRHGALYVHVQRFPKGQMRLYRHAARLQTVSHAIEHAIISQDPVSKIKVRTIPNPLPHEPEELDIANSWNERENCILYVGRVHPEKGLHLILDAFVLLASRASGDWKLRVVGPWDYASGGGGERYYKLLQRKAIEVKDRVEFVGSVFNADALARYYKRAKLFVYPSLAERGEAFPLAPLEAMSYGCPPLVSKLECFRDYVEDGKTGYVFDHRTQNPTETLARKLELVLLSEKEMVTVAQHAYNTAKNYTLERIADRYLKDFELICFAKDFC